MKMIAGFLCPHGRHGRQRLRPRRGGDPIAAKRRIGYLPEGAPSYGEMTPRASSPSSPTVRGCGALAGQRRWTRWSGGCSWAGAGPADRDAVQGLQAPRRPGPGHPARSAGADPRRADRRPRPEPEARGARLIRHGARQDHRHLHPHPRRGRRGLHAARSSSPRGRCWPTTRRRTGARSRYHGAVSCAWPRPTPPAGSCAAGRRRGQRRGERQDGRLTAFPRPGPAAVPPSATGRQPRLALDEMQLEPAGWTRCSADHHWHGWPARHRRRCGMNRVMDGILSIFRRELAATSPRRWPTCSS
jgi:ABC-2 type transport system ATP-binding protein